MSNPLYYPNRDMLGSRFPTNWTLLKRLMWVRIMQGGSIPPEYETVTGNPVTFETVRPAPLRQLSVAFSPQQNLNGYDAPWPAGGGVNLYDFQANTNVSHGSYPATYNAQTGEISMTANAADMFFGNIKTAAGQAWSADVGWLVDVSNLSTVTVALSNPLFTKNFYNKYGSDKKALASYVEVSSNVFTVDVSDCAYLGFRFGYGQSVSGTTYKTTVTVSAGSTAPTAWSPYENLCPISGWSSVTVEQTGENVAENSTLYQGAIRGDTGVTVSSTTRLYTSNFIPVKAGTYTISTVPDLANVVRVYGEENVESFISSEGDGGTWHENGRTITFTADRYIRIMLSYNMGAQTAIVPSDLQYLNVSSDYRSISISLGQTVYSGTVDVISGVVTVDKVAFAANGTETWDIINDKYVCYAPVDKPIATRNTTSSTDHIAVCDRFKSIGVQYRGSLTSGTMCKVVSDNRQIAFDPSGYASIDAFKADLANNPMTIVYRLAEPQTIQLTPQQVSSLFGENNVWASTNGDLTVEYRSN